MEFENNFVTEEDKNSTAFLNNNRNNHILNEKTICEVIEILFDHLKDETDNIDKITRRSLIEISENNLNSVFNVGMESLKNLISNNTNNKLNIEIMENYVDLLNEILEKYGSSLEKNSYKIASSLIIEAIQNLIASQGNSKEAERVKALEKKVYTLNKILIILSKFYFNEILNDLMQLFVPGSVPHRIVIELLTQMASVYPLKASQTFNDCVSRTLPILASIQEENMRVIFSKFFSQICESLIISLESCESNNNSNYNSIRVYIDSMSHLFSTAFDLINAQWINARNFGNKLQIINSLILMGAIVPENSLRNNLENIINLFSQNLKKENISNSASNSSTALISDHIMLCKSFRILFENIVGKYKERLETCANNLLNAIFPILNNINISPNIKEFDQDFIQLKSELLKIAFLLFTNYIDKSFNFFIAKFEVPSLIERLANVYLLKTMLLRSENIINSYKEMLYSAISKATHENDLEFKYAIFELIYILFEKNFVNSESSIKLISYLIKESGYSDDEIESGNISNKNYPFYTNLKMVRDKAENVLIDIINKIQDSEKFFWPTILDYLYDFKYDGSSFIINKIISAVKNIYDEKNKTEEFYSAIDFSRSNSNLPTPSQLMIKAFVILSNPLKRQGLCKVVLQSLKIIIPLLSSELKGYQIDTNQIEVYFRRGKYFDFNHYHDVLITFWEKILNELKNGEFLTSLSESILDHITKYKEYIAIIGFLMKLQGLVLAKVNKRETIKNQLDNLFNMVHPEFKAEVINANVDQSTPPKEIRSGLGEAFGLAAKNHLDLVLDKINAIFKSEIQYKKPTGFASLFASSKDPEISSFPMIISSLITCLGCVAKNADANLLSTRINSNFLSYIDSYFNNDKSTKQTKFACIFAMGNIFKSLHKLSSIYLDKGDVFILQNRENYIENMIKIFKAEKTLNEMKITALNNVAYLSQLDPPVSLEQCRNFIYLAFSLFDIKELQNFGNLKEQDIELKEQTLESINNILESILIHENHLTSNLEKITVTTDNYVLICYENILNYEKEILTSWDFFSLIMEKFIERYLKETESRMKMVLTERIQIFVNSKKCVKFNNEDMQNWIASIICLMIVFFDENEPTDKEAIFLGISRLFTGLGVFDLDYSLDYTSVIESIANIFKNKFEKDDYLFIFKKFFYLLKIKNNSVNKHAVTLILKLISNNTEYFKDPDGSKIKNKEDTKSQENLITNSNSLKKYSKTLDEIIENLITILETIIKDEGALTAERYINTLKIPDELSKINLTPIIDACLKEEYGLPLPLSLQSILEQLCKEKSLVTKVFTKITDIINNGDPGYENKPNYAVCASTIVLGTMLATRDSVIIPLIKKFFPQLLSTLLLRIGSAHSINYTVEAFKKREEDPRNQTCWALKNLLSYSEEEEISTCLESGGSIQDKLMNTYEYDEGIYELMLIFCKKADIAKQMAMFNFLEGFLDRPYNGQRVAVITCYAQFLNFASVIYHGNTDVDLEDWRNKLIVELTKTITDSDELARKQSIRGLANLCKVYLDCCVDIDSYIKITQKVDSGKLI